MKWIKWQHLKQAKKSRVWGWGEVGRYFISVSNTSSQQLFLQDPMALKNLTAHCELTPGNRNGEREWSNWDHVFQLCSIFVNVVADLFLSFLSMICMLLLSHLNAAILARIWIEDGREIFLYHTCTRLLVHLSFAMKCHGCPFGIVITSAQLNNNKYCYRAQWHINYFP